MDFLRKHYEKSATEYASSDSVLAAAIHTSRFVLDKWQAINSYTPAYAAALLLHPTYREAYINKQWPQSWRIPAITVVRALWNDKYKNKSKAVQAVSSPKEEESDKLAQWQASLRYTSSVHIPEELVHLTKSMPVLIDDAIQWWLEPTQQLNYTNLARMAIDILLIKPMSAESERVFSGCRKKLSWDRTCFSAANPGFIECHKNCQKNLYLEAIDTPIDEGEEDVEVNQEDQEGQGDTLEG
jgi:hypothetical protein